MTCNKGHGRSARPSPTHTPGHRLGLQDPRLDTMGRLHAPGSLTRDSVPLPAPLREPIPTTEHPPLGPLTLRNPQNHSERTGWYYYCVTKEGPRAERRGHRSEGTQPGAKRGPEPSQALCIWCPAWSDFSDLPPSSTEISRCKCSWKRTEIQPSGSLCPARGTSALAYLPEILDIEEVKGLEEFTPLEAKLLAAGRQEGTDVLKAQELRREAEMGVEDT